MEDGNNRAEGDCLANYFSIQELGKKKKFCSLLKLFHVYGRENFEQQKISEKIKINLLHSVCPIFFWCII